MMPPMALDPQAKALLDALAQMEGPPILESEPAEVREAMAALASMSEGADEEVREVVDQTIPGPGGALRVRIYTPVLATEGAPQACLVWYHGGGWVIGDLDTTDGVCRALCGRSAATVVSVDYRLAPEHPYPAALEDAEAAFDWVRDHADDLYIAPDRIAVGGDSAGGNLAALVAQSRRGQVAFQLLIYPATDLTNSHPSHEENAEGYLLTRDHMVWFTGHYLGDHDRTDPRVSPLHADDLSGVAPAFVLTAEFDPLRDEGEAYAARLEDAGVEVTSSRYDGMIHAFFQLNGAIDRANDALDDAAAALTRALT
jgi:acetyl esterase